MFSTSGTRSSLSVPVHSTSAYHGQYKNANRIWRPNAFCGFDMRSSKRPVGHLACAIRPPAVPDQVCRVPTRGFFRLFHCTEPMFAESGGDRKCKQEWIPTSSIHAIHIAEIRCYSLEMYAIVKMKKNDWQWCETTSSRYMPVSCRAGPIIGLEKGAFIIRSPCTAMYL